HVALNSFHFDTVVRGGEAVLPQLLFREVEDGDARAQEREGRRLAPASAREAEHAPAREFAEPAARVYRLARRRGVQVEQLAREERAGLDEPPPALGVVLGDLI